MNEILLAIFQFVVFMFSAIVHEVSHGLAAYKLGDDTAKQMGRLSLDPRKHLDPFGSLLLPLFLLIVRSPVLFGWAKPVPYNPANLKNPKIGAALIGLAGPTSNILLAIIFGILIRVLAVSFGPKIAAFLIMLNVIVFINIMLAIFNLVPIPPLDGSKLLFAVLPYKYYRLQNALETYGGVILLFFIFFGFQIIIPLIEFVYKLIVGPYGFI